LRWTPLHELALPLAARSVRAAATPALFAARRMALPPESAATSRAGAEPVWLR
jgi:hypothetical protein